MMRLIKPSTLRGKVSIPSSKSYLQRAIAIASITKGITTIENVTYCADVLSAIECAKGVGAHVTLKDSSLIIRGKQTDQKEEINCGESGLAVRMFAPIAACSPNQFVIKGEGSLKKRPIGMIQDALRSFGVVCHTNSGYLPITIQGPLKGGERTIDGSITSQLLTGLLIALPTLSHHSVITVKDLKSKPYIDMTLEIIQQFGGKITHENYQKFEILGGQQYQPINYRVGGDWSAAAFWIVAGAISGDLTLQNLNINSSQGDRVILDIIKRAGVTYKTIGEDLKIQSSPLHPFEADLTDTPDLFPPLVTLASVIDGVSTLKGVDRLTYKESNRGETLQKVFQKLGVTINLHGDLMEIIGGTLGGEATVQSYDDHRIAMAASIAALRGDRSVKIFDAEAVTKSYPHFFNHLKQLNGEVI